MTEQTASVTRSSERAKRNDDHLDELPDGCGCAEVWEHLSEQRVADD